MQRLLTRLALLLLLCLAAQAVAYRFVWKKYFASTVGSFHEKEMLTNALGGNVEIIYFGDSILGATAPDDTDQASIPYMLERKLGRPVLNLSHGAYHLDIYDSFVSYILNFPHQLPTDVIIPVNIASFSAFWDQMPEYQFATEREKLMNPYLYFFAVRPLAIFKHRFFPKLSREEYNQLPALLDKNKIGVLENFPDAKLSHKENLPRMVAFRTLGHIDAEHRKLKSLASILTKLKAHKIRPIVYITPLDYETGEAEVPGEFSRIVKQKIALVKAVAEAQGVEVLDLSYSLGRKTFFWENYPDEHLRDEGREFIAAEIQKRYFQ